MKRIPIYLFVAAVTCYGGIRYEATAIQQTCEHDVPTILNGTPYVCLTAEQANGIAKQLQQRGA